MVLTVGDICDYLEKTAPLSFAEDYDNSGLLIGRREREVHTLMLCVDASRPVIRQAEEAGADFLMAHHPLIFHPLKNASESDYTGERVMSLAENRIALYAAHTNMDSVPGGNIDHAAALLGLQKVRAVAEEGQVPCLRIGSLPEPMDLSSLARLVMERFQLSYVRVVAAESENNENELIRQVAVCTGSGMDFAPLAMKYGAGCLVTGDISYHRAEAAAAAGLNLIDASHFETDRLSLQWLKDALLSFAARHEAQLEVVIAEERDVFEIVDR